MHSSALGFSSTTGLQDLGQKVYTDIWDNQGTQVTSLNTQPVLTLKPQGGFLKIEQIQHLYTGEQVNAIGLAQSIVGTLFPENAARHVNQLDIYKDNFVIQMDIEQILFDKLTTNLRGNVSPLVGMIDEQLQLIEFPQSKRPVPFNGSKSTRFLPWAIHRWAASRVSDARLLTSLEKQGFRYLGKVMMYYIADSWAARGTKETSKYIRLLYGPQGSQRPRRGG